MSRTPCEQCAYYNYDEEYDCYHCEINLDEDEMERFLRGSDEGCHYFHPYDEYAVVRKQN